MLALTYYIIGLITSIILKYSLYLRVKYGILRTSDEVRSQLKDFFEDSFFKFILLSAYDAYKPAKNIQDIINIDNIYIQ